MKTVVSFLVLAVAATGAQDIFTCPHDLGFYPHERSCDKYYACEGGVATLKTCGNGLAFDDSDPEFLRESCDYMHNVDCAARPDNGLAQDYVDFFCPEEDGFYPHETKCDAYWSCKDGQPEYKLCGNGLAFDDTRPDREHCNYLFFVNCGNRTELEPAISTPNCPYLFGIFPTDDDCSVFYSCWDGESSRYQCAPGLAYDRHSRICTWMDKVDECSSQRAASQQGFACPAPGELAVAGSFSRHAHPDDCRQYYVCLDGIPREYGCPIGTVFQIGDTDGSGKCTEPESVPGCEDYYGDLDLDALRKSKLSIGNVGQEDALHAAAGVQSHTPRRPASRPAAPAVEVPAEEPAEASQ